MIINIKHVKNIILDESISAYSLEKETGINRPTITAYRTGSANIENMSLQVATKIMNYIKERGLENMEYKVLEHSGYDIHEENFENLEDAINYAEAAFDRLATNELKTNFIEVVKDFNQAEYSPESFNVDYEVVKEFKDSNYKELK